MRHLTLASSTPDPVADVMPVSSRAVYERVAGLDEVSLWWLIGVLCGLHTDAVAQCLDLGNVP